MTRVTEPSTPTPSTRESGAGGPVRAELVIDLDALRANVRTLADRCAPAALMVVVKADGYGHGMVPVARAARDAGAAWLGVATLDEALALRASGDTGPLLCWLGVPGEDYRSVIGADVEVTAYSLAEVEEIAAAARAEGRPARMQLKVDTGLSRGGATPHDWPAVVQAALAAVRAGDVEVTGIWSHFACADEPDHPANAAQERAYAEALEVARGAGLDPGLRHLCNSAGALTRPHARYDLVRCGLAAYGLSPVPDLSTSQELGLTPVMTARSQVALSKRVPAGAGVSYGHTYTARRESTVALVPVGYGDGVPVHGSSVGPVSVAGARHTVSGRVCMDQLVVDVGDQPVTAGDEVVLFGTGAGGGPTAEEWAQACGTIVYEIVTRIGGRFRRTYRGASPDREESA
jgi:alanine racemase